MDEFLGSVEFNQKGDLLISSSYLTYQYWTGFVAYLTSDQVQSKVKNDTPLMLSSLEVKKNTTSGVCAAKWALDDKILVGTERGEVMLFKLNSESSESKLEHLTTKHEHDSLVLCLDTKFDSEIAISGSEDSRIKIWDLNEQISIRTYKAHDYAVCSVAFNPKENKCFLSTSQDNRALLWDTRKEKPAFSIRHGLNGYPSCSHWSGLDLNLIALGSETGELGIYDLRMIDKTPFSLSKVHERLVRKVKFNPNEGLISTVSEDCTTKCQRIIAPSVTNEPGISNIHTYKHQDYVTDLAWNPKNAYEYLTCSWDGLIKSHVVNSKIPNGI